MRWFVIAVAYLALCVGAAFAQMPRMSAAEKATMYCQGKVATFAPLEATVRCLYVRRLSGNKYEVVVEKLN